MIKKEVVHAQVHKNSNSNKEGITITEVTDLDKTPDGILVEDLESDYETKGWNRNKEISKNCQNNSAESCQQPKKADSQKKNFHWGDTVIKQT